MTVSLLQAVGSPRGHFKYKHNRAAKLLASWDELKTKLEGMVIRGYGRTETARLAYAVLVMMETGIRVGNEGSAEGFVCENKYHADYGKTVQTFGLTTLRNDHLQRKRDQFLLSFTGKKLVDQELQVSDDILVRYCPQGASDELWLGITYPQLVKFVKRYVGKYTPKDIRMACVNRLFIEKWLQEYGDDYNEATSKSTRKAVLRNCIVETAEQIGHTAGVCRSSYLSDPLLRTIINTQVRVKFGI